MSSVKKIIWVAHEGEKSGANNAMLAYAVALKAQYNITVIVPSKGSVWEECNKHGLAVQQFYYYSEIFTNHSSAVYKWIKKRLRNAITFFQVFSYILKEKPDVVITNSIVSPPLFALAAGLLRVQHVWYVQEFGNKDHGIKFDWGYRFTLNYINLLSKKIIVVSDAVKKHLSDVIPENKMRTVFNCVEVPEAFWGKGPGVKDRPFKVLHIAQIAPGKNQLEGIKAVKLLRDRGADVVLEIAGAVLDPAYQQQLNKYVVQEKLQSLVLFSGFSKNPFEKISNANAVILCSRNEACALTIFETLRIGTPIVVSNTGGNTEIIKDTETGLAYQYQNPADLADKIHVLYADNETATRIATNAKKYSLAHYRISSSSKQIVDVIEAN